MLVLTVIGALLAGACLWNVLFSSGSGLHEVAWIGGAVLGALIVAVSRGLVHL